MNRSLVPGRWQVFTRNEAFVCEITLHTHTITQMHSHSALSYSAHTKTRVQNF